MRKYLPATIIGIALIALTFVLPDSRPIAAQNQKSTAVFDSDGKLKLPTGYRRWIFVGAPLTLRWVIWVLCVLPIEDSSCRMQKR